MPVSKPETIDQYISTFPTDVQLRMEKIRSVFHKAIPGIEERISYAIPAFFLDGKYLLYFAGYKKHIGMYPVPAGIPTLEKDYAPYKTSGKGTIQFPHDKPLPLDLITKIIKYSIEKRSIKTPSKTATKKFPSKKSATKRT